MSESRSPRLQVLVDGTAVPARILIELKQVTGLGLADLRALIASGAPVVDVEMFTNDWFESGAARVLDLLSAGEDEGVGYVLRETCTEPGGSEAVCDASRITLEELRSIVGSGQEERTRIEELDDLRYGVDP